MVKGKSAQLSKSLKILNETETVNLLENADLSEKSRSKRWVKK